MSKIITLRDYITSGGKYPKFWEMDAWQEHRKNAVKTVAAACMVIERIGYKRATAVTSGWRPLAHNLAIGGSKNSHHIFCRAIDLWDPYEEIGKYLDKNRTLLEELDIAIETPLVTHKSKEASGKWCHIQIVTPPSGNRVFFP